MRSAASLSFMLLILITKSFCQTITTTSGYKTRYLDSLRGQVNDRNFRKIAFADFSKFLIGDDNQFGRAINHVSIQVDKPRATLNLYTRTGQFGFFNFLLSSGFENDLFSLVSDKKPASSFSGTLSYSFLPWKSYKYYPTEKHKLWGALVRNFDDSVYTAHLNTKITELKGNLKRRNVFINSAFYIRRTGRAPRLDLLKSNALVDSLLLLNAVESEIDSLERERNRRTAYVDTLALRAKWSTRKWFWITVAANYGGVAFKYYNRDATDGQLVKDVRSYTRAGTLSFNFLYKSMHNSFWTKLADNGLLTLGLSYGKQNNFSDFAASEYKSIQTTDSAGLNTTYTKTDTRQVYTDILKEYNALTSYLEVVKLFGANGTLGIRNRLIWENPEEKSGLNTQTNWEAGFLFNTTSKKEKDITKLSLELFIKFRDLSGNNVTEKDKQQKFQDRHTVGIRTNLPFRFLNL